MAKIDINGTQFEYFDKGAGTPIVLVHGSASDYRTWQAQQTALAEDFRVITYSRRYHWPNDPISNDVDYSMDQHVNDLKELIQNLNIAPAGIVGHSYGAFISLLLAVRHPKLVRSLVLAEPPVYTLYTHNTPTISDVLRLLVTKPKTALAIMKFGARGFSPAQKAARRGDLARALEVFGKAVFGEEFYRRLSKARLEQARLNTFKAEFLGSGFPRISEEQVRSVTCPVLLVGGEHSPAFFQRLLFELEWLLPQCTLTRLKDASHLIHEDVPADYSKAVTSFLSKT